MVCSGFHWKKNILKKIQVGLPDAEIYAIEKDKNGAIWLAMDTGVVKLGKRNGNWRIDIDYRMTSSLQGELFMMYLLLRTLVCILHVPKDWV